MITTEDVNKCACVIFSSVATGTFVKMCYAPSTKVKIYLKSFANIVMYQ